MPRTHPAYLELFESGELARRAAQAIASLADCAGCGRECHVDRLGRGSGQAVGCVLARTRNSPRGE